MIIFNLAIEVTRRCNARCAHCLRGESENIDISPAYVDLLFSKVNYISSLTLTGGEPSLVPNLIEEILQLAEKHGTEIGSFYLATNAINVSEAFLIALIKLYSYCTDNEYSLIEWSNDIFHPDSLGASKLEAFKFANSKYDEDKSIEDYPYGVINEGRGSECGLECRPVTPEVFEIEDGDVIDGTVYLNCEGNIIAGCDWSYESQRDPENIVCSVEDFSIEKLEEFNERE